MGLPWIRQNDLRCPYCGYGHKDELELYLYQSKNEYTLNYPCDKCKITFTIRPTNLGFIKLYKTKENKKQDNGQHT